MARATDAFVFVASSMPQDQEANLASLEELRSIEDTAGVPIVFQLNKQDLPTALNPELLKNMLETGEAMVVPSSAIHGTGVFEALKAAALKATARICLEDLSG